MKSLVVYYTRTGNAKFAAETVAAELGSDIEEIVDLKKRAGKPGWISAGKDSTQEKETQIAPTKLVPADYDLIVLGTPIWAWRPTPAIRTHIAKNDLSGKKVALFFAMASNLKQAVEKTKAYSRCHLCGRHSIAECVGQQGRNRKENRRMVQQPQSIIDTVATVRLVGPGLSPKRV